MDLRVDQRDKEGIRILELHGPVVIGRSESLLRSTVLNLPKTATINIILNLASVSEIDDDGLGALIVCHASLRRAGGALKLLNPTRVHMELFVLMKLEGVFGLNVAEGARKDQSNSDSFRSCSSASIVAREPGLTQAGMFGSSTTRTPGLTSSPPAPPTQSTRLMPAIITALMIEAVPRTWSAYRLGSFQPGLKALINAS